MILAVEIENFMSIRDRQRIDLQVGGAVDDCPERYAPTWPGSSRRVPKVIAFFGANASGKSTVLRSLQYLVWFVRESFQFGPAQSLPFEPFWDGSCHDAPTVLAVEFAGPESVSGVESGKPQCRYRYELRLHTAGGKRTVLNESLFFWPSRAKRLVRLFERDAAGDVVAGPDFGLAGHKSVLKKILRDNASVISTLAQLDHAPSLALQQAAYRVSSNIFLEKLQVNESQMLQYYQANPALLDALNGDLPRIDLGIQSMMIGQGPNGLIATFRHRGLSREVPLMLESHGTRQFLQIYPFLMDALQRGGIAIVDELDLAIHPTVLPEILRWFYSPQRNPHSAQLWMTCQNSSLLEELVKEEIYFCEKDPTGATSVYGLKDIQGVRRIDNFYRKYMGGTYGAVPTIG
ncbi:AAA family ATPase [Bordetella bronchialis]|uniref:Abortive infection protein n=1 Tax=Bordetella bronchialis TaxID=463025 RepID=A0A193G1Q6_9BORD|nr:ATP-binding protein [Bordetella bronchialis]ANN73937.1 abortive infection protein [Bordetella bronchialis]